MKYLSSLLFLILLVNCAIGFAWDPTPDPAYQDTGDKSRRPVIFVHGQNGAGEQFERQWMHFMNNGYPPSWVVPFDYDTSIRGQRRTAGDTGPYKRGTTDDLDAFIDAVRKRTGFEKVDLVGHSRGTSESAAYLSDPVRASKVAHYASIGGGNATNPNGVPSIAISGMGDFRPGPAASNGGKVGWMPAYQDHVMICTSDESFWVLFTFLNDGEKPATIAFAPETRPQVGGFVKSYIHNMTLEDAIVEVWSVNPDTGIRLESQPLTKHTVREDGSWGPFSAEPGQPYEFVISGTESRKPSRYFRMPFQHSDQMVYFRIAAEAEGYRSSLFDKAPHLLTDKSPVFIVRQQNGSLVPGIMTLSVNGHDLIRPPIIETTTESRQGATVGLYLADGNANGKTDRATVEGFGGAFVSSADFFTKADKNATVTFKLNKNVINVPAYPASEAGPLNVVFENFR